MNKDELISELNLKSIRSSGSGGQHVNKVSTKVELQFNIENSEALNDEQKERLTTKLKSKLTNDNRLILQCDESRSQRRNKEIVIQRFLELIEINLKKNKKRKPTKLPKAVKKKRLESKRKNAQKKANRKPPELD